MTHSKNRFMIKCGFVQKHIEKQLNVKVRTPEIKGLSEKAVLSLIHSKNLYQK